MIPFTYAYWDWLRGKLAFEPMPEQFGLDAVMGGVIKRQCETEFKAIRK